MPLDKGEILLKRHYYTFWCLKALSRIAAPNYKWSQWSGGTSLELGARVKNEKWLENVFYDLLWLESGKKWRGKTISGLIRIDVFPRRESVPGLVASDTGLMMSSVLLPGDGVLMMFKLTPEPPDMEPCQNLNCHKPEASVTLTRGNVYLCRKDCIHSEQIYQNTQQSYRLKNKSSYSFLFLFGIYTPDGRQGPSLMTSSMSGREQKHSHLSNPKVNFNFNEDNHSLTTSCVDF